MPVRQFNFLLVFMHVSILHNKFDKLNLFRQTVTNQVGKRYLYSQICLSFFFSPTLMHVQRKSDVPSFCSLQNILFWMGDGLLGVRLLLLLSDINVRSCCEPNWSYAEKRLLLFFFWLYQETASPLELLRTVSRPLQIIPE